MNDRVQDSDITICSVYHSLQAKRLLELNYDLVKKMNPDAQIHWIVADNTPKGFADKINESKFTIVPGADGFRPVPDWLVGSYHHSEAVNNSLKHITTRFALFLDIDFYIVRKNWMRVVVAHMEKNDLALFGVPWHPAHVKKFRYFPSPHTFFVDLKKIPVSQIDFRPDYDVVMLLPGFADRVARKIRKIKHAISKRLEIGESRDTGFRMYDRFHSRVSFEYLTPVFVPATDLRDMPEAASVWERIMPDRFSYIPKKSGYYTEAGFRSAGFADARREHWEEFMWQGKPYGFHVRGTDRLKNDLDGRIKAIQNILDNFGEGVS